MKEVFDMKNKLLEHFKILFPTILCGLLILVAFGVKFLNGTHIVYAGLFILSFVIGGYAPAKEGFGELIFDKTLNVDILMVLAALGASAIGYFEEGALLIFIFSLSGAMEEMAMEKSKQAIEALMNLTPPTATVLTDNNEQFVIQTKDLKVGNRIVIKKGESIPIDSLLESDYALINESAMTGESIPVEKIKGDSLIGGTINENHQIIATVSVENEQTLFSKIVRLVEQSQQDKTKTATMIDQIENKYVKLVLVVVPLFVLVTFLVLRWDFMTAFYRGMILLTVASPCALVASATPATLSAISNGAKNGLLFKGGKSVNQLSEIDAVIFDKTGTLTTGNLVVEEVLYTTLNQVEVNRIVKTIEMTSTHPIAKAIVNYLVDEKMTVLQCIKDLTGFGFVAVDTDQNEWKIGKKSFVVEEKHSFDERIYAFESRGYTLIYVSKNHVVQAIYVLADQLKLESMQVIKALKALNITPIMMTGDSENTANYVGQQLGIDKIYANCLPNDKLNFMNDLKNTYHSIAMVGDGINDAPALAHADVSFAMGKGSDIAMESADVVVMQDSLSKIPYAVNLAYKMKRITLQNIIFSLSIIVALIIANVFQVLSLPLGVIGHEGSTILVILNGLRLLKTI